MYQKPALERFGTLRELTLLGMGTQCVWWCGDTSTNTETQRTS